MKKFNVIFCFLFVFLCGIVGFSCDLDQKDAMVIYERGASAYEVAVENGFEGTVDEWLESLKGQNGTNGLDGERGADASVTDLFEKAVEFGLYTNDADGYRAFLNDYFGGNLTQDNVLEVTNKCLNQVVSVYVEDDDGIVQCGAGVFYEVDRTNNVAYIVTNYHVVSCYSEQTVGYATKYTYYEGKTINVYLYGTESVVSNIDGTVSFGVNAISAEYIGGSANYDLAVLKISGDEFVSKIKNSPASAVKFADTSNIQLGTRAIAIGNAMTSGVSICTGYVSFDSEYIALSIAGQKRQLHCFRMDTPINGGNSGGGVFNENCELIGIANARNANYVDAEGYVVVYDNVSYAIPATNVKNVVKNIIDFYTIFYDEDASDNTVGVYKYLIGITLAVDNFKNEYNEIQNTNIISEDVIVSEVTGLTARTIGMKTGDIIRQIKVTRGDDTKTYDILRRFQLLDNMLTLRPNDHVTYIVDRQNADTGLYESVTLTEFVVSTDGYAVYKGAN